MKDVTFIIKTFNRPRCVEMLCKSCLKHFPSVPVIVADDGNVKTPFTHTKVKMLDMPFDSGLSSGRNLLVDNVHTKYFILLDDDFLINFPDGVKALYDSIEEHNEYDMIGGWLSNQPQTKQTHGVFVEEEKGVYKVVKTTGKESVIPSDFILNFFIAKTDSFKKNSIRWDDELKMGEHLLFFFNIWKNHDLKIGFTEKAYIYHDYKFTTNLYATHRKRAAKFAQDALKRYNIKRITTISNHTYHAPKEEILIRLHGDGQGSRPKDPFGVLEVESNRLRLTKTANNWHKKVHCYGITVNRDGVLKSNVILQKLKNLSHPNIMQVYDFNDKHVWVEYINGCVLSNKDKFASQVDKEKHCYLDDAEKPFDFNLIRDAVKFLHNHDIALTDIASFNIMVDTTDPEQPVPKIIDLICAMPLTPELKSHDLKRLDVVEAELRKDFPNKITT
jgi:glycosyltransferase involved in cell wall biosynthesis